MTPPTTIHGTSTGGTGDGGADDLWYARAAIASSVDFDDPTLAQACRTVIASANNTVTANERDRAEHMLCLVEGEMA